MPASPVHGSPLSLLSLPIELQQHILAYTLPPPLVPLAAVSTLSAASSWSTARERADRLSCYSLVTRHWRDWAQSELLKHVVLESDAQLRRFLDYPAAHRTRLRVETLRIGGVRRGRQLDGTGLSELFRRLHVLGGTDNGSGGIREVWLVQVDNLDLRDLQHLDNLRALVCVWVSLAVHRCATDDPTQPPRGVPPLPARFPHLHTLVLQEVHISSTMRTILYESHVFSRLRVLAFDAAEVLEQIFDGNPDGLPRLVAMRPAHDLQFEYYDALDQGGGREFDEAVESGSDSEALEARDHLDGEARTGLLYLNASADFLSCIEHYAPWLPDSTTRFSLDLDEMSSGGPENGPQAFAHLVAVTHDSSRPANPVVDGHGNAEPAWKPQDPPGEVALFLGNLDKLILPAPNILQHFGLVPPLPAPLDSIIPASTASPWLIPVPPLDPAAAAFLTHVHNQGGLEISEPSEPPLHIAAEQDRLIPWRFLVEADQTVRSLARKAES
ncbi:hypothetical protein JCM3774_001876 [Rhodotorula dairenensis]